MGFSYIAGITRVANILSIFAFAATFLEYEISDIMKAAEDVFVLTISIMRLITTIFDMNKSGISLQ